MAVEHALAVDASGGLVAWDAPDAFIRGHLDLVGTDEAGTSWNLPEQREIARAGSIPTASTIP